MADEPLERPPISSSRLNAVEVARHTFATVRRGFDPNEVRAYLELVARELQNWEQRDERLREQVAEAQEAARNPVLDEATLSTALGQQSAKVLRNAHDEAARIMGHAEEQSAAMLRDAQQQATDLRVEAESTAAGRIAEAELAAGSVEQASRAEGDALLAQARVEAEALVERAREQGRSVLMKAQEARRDVLADLAHRRKALHLQIEQFRAARDELAATVLGVRDSVDNIVAGLGQADDRARAAAAGVAEGGVLTEPIGGADEEFAAVEAALAGEDIGATEGDGGMPGTVDAVVLDVVEVEVESEVTTDDPGEVETPVADEAVSGDSDESETSDAAGAAESGGSVDALFARIRAGQGEDASPVGDEQSSAEAITPAQGVPPVAAEGAAGGEGSEADGSEAAGSEGDEAGEPTGGLSGQDAALLELRSSVLDPIVANLSRRLKRSLQDDQNRLLDRLRSDAVAADLPLPGERQRQAYVDTALPQLREAFAAGAAFARELSAAESGAEPDPAAVEALADELAAEIVVTLRRRLSGDEAGGEDPVERVRAAYREWRGERVERLVGDVALGAFSEGVLSGTGSGAGVRWLPAGGDGVCADCDDNSLAEPVPPGDEFPTGHRHPPAHAGCRCLVAPATA